VAVAVGSSRIAGVGSGGNGLIPARGLMKTARMRIPAINARASTITVRIFKVLSFILNPPGTRLPITFFSITYFGRLSSKAVFGGFYVTGWERLPHPSSLQ